MEGSGWPGMTCPYPSGHRTEAKKVLCKVPWGAHPALGSPPCPGEPSLPWGALPALGSLLCSGEPSLPWGAFSALGSPPCPGEPSLLWGALPALGSPPCPGEPSLPWGAFSALGSLLCSGEPSLLWGALPALGSLLCPGEPSLPWGAFSALGSLPCPGEPSLLWGALPALGSPSCPGEVFLLVPSLLRLTAPSTDTSPRFPVSLLQGLPWEVMPQTLGLGHQASRALGRVQVAVGGRGPWTLVGGWEAERAQGLLCSPFERGGGSGTLRDIKVSQVGCGHFHALTTFPGDSKRLQGPGKDWAAGN
uniref:protein THEM6 isoform X2 n=1 Tax=Callithrix jacchus TaxID=9483 RepID=UPI00159DC867|nr:protein THEM6 isoform X2 [Callithrix jacchus]